MSDNIFAYYDDRRDAVVIRKESGTEVALPEHLGGRVFR